MSLGLFMQIGLIESLMKTTHMPAVKAGLFNGIII
jgi:hypothetical protein